MPANVAITASPWYTREPDSPRLPEQGFALEWVTLPATRKDKATLALLGAFRLPGRYAQMYGGRIPGALQIVAINVKTGATHFNHAERAHGVPISAVMIPDPPPPNPGEAQRVAVEGLFNVDLCDQLGLPPEAADYLVFVWLDEVLSKTRVVTVPEGKHRPRPAGTLPGRTDPAPFEFAPLPLPNLDPGQQVAIHLDRSGSAGDPAQVRVAGRAARQLLAPPPKEDEPGLPISVITMGCIDRDLRWASAPVPQDWQTDKDLTWQFKLGAVLPASERPQKIFVMGSAGRELSRLMVLDPTPASATGTAPE